ncbi:hypothetical protein D0962_10330 [Leptolyngbyaceae cyanobacterium CCMR0082]|uniref:Sulfotransferase domain-containing protein n=2 Tax=Adonisia turfae TaxID=2950184 RepID=A0A6M0S3S6_9CYAN|nr:hypothetical protein [Adonisia turfae]MDV3351554.1 hypothetical protein [Leptothoe sp. LEGE 181152]NEZ54629.1 hypothetical protein [Adonisia turfae CCMR0081]NEZ63174.1 hypothetical protein [Adonisia turfae CCMR0082]
MQLIIHPGYGKCGTSSIQAFLYSNLQYLEKTGIYLPDSNFNFSFERNVKSFNFSAPNPYFQDLITSRKISVFEKRIKQVLSQAKKVQCKAILISSEVLGHEWSFASAREIHAVFAKYFQERTVCFYIRRQDDYLVSSWEQWYHKVGESLESYVNESLQNHSPNYLKIVSFLEECYGPSSLQVFPINREVLIGKNLISDFCQRINLSIPESLVTDIRTNVGLNPYLCDILYRIPHLYNGHHDYSVKNLLTNFIGEKDLLLRNGKSILSMSLRRRVVEHFRSDNELLKTKYFNNLSVDEIFGLNAYAQEPLDNGELRLQIEELKNVIAIQMELIIHLLKESDKTR